MARDDAAVDALVAGHVAVVEGDTKASADWPAKANTTKRAAAVIDFIIVAGALFVCSCIYWIAS